MVTFVALTDTEYEPSYETRQRHITVDIMRCRSHVRSETEGHLVGVVQQHHVGDPEVFGRQGGILQSVRVQRAHVLSVPQPHRSSSTHRQILTRARQVQHLEEAEDEDKTSRLGQTQSNGRTPPLRNSPKMLFVMQFNLVLM